MELVNTNGILKTLKMWVENKQVIDAHTWVDAAQKLNILSSDEHDNLFNLMQTVAKMKVEHLKNGDTVAKAKNLVEATDAYKQMLIQKAKISQIEEAIRIAKIQARLKDNEYRHQ